MMIRTNRTRLRRFQATDLNNLTRLESDPEIMRFTSLRVPLTEEQSQQRLNTMIEKESLRAPLGIWAAELQGGGEFVGWFMLLNTGHELPELGFMIVREHWGKGLASEIAGALKDHGLKTLGLKGIVAKTDPENLASIRVLQKIGFRLTGVQASLNVYECRNSD